MTGRIDVVARAGERQAAKLRASIALRAQAFGGIRAQAEGDAVILEGRGLLERWLRNADLRTALRNRP